MTSQVFSRPHISRFLSLCFALAFVALTLAACGNPEQSKAEHVARGEALLKEKKYQEASLEFRNALQIDSELGAGHWGLARAYEGLERIPEAADALKKAAQSDPNNLEARTKLGNYYLLYSKAPNADTERLTADAELLAREVLSRDPNDIEGHILLGNVFFTRGNSKEALAELERAIAINPNRVESYLSLSRYYLGIKDAARAEESLKRAVAIGGDKTALAFMEYGRFLVAQNRAADAEAMFRRAVEADSRDRDARFMLASFYFSNKQLDKAEEAYKALAEIDGDRPDGRATLADFYAATNRNADAARVYEQLISTAPDFARARYRLGEILLQSGDIGGATKQIDELLAKNNRDTQALVLRSRVKLAAGDAKSALTDLEEVLRTEPNSLGGLYLASDAALRLGNIEQARIYANELERYYPTYLPARLLLIQANLSGGDARTALRDATELSDRASRAVPDALTTPQLVAEVQAKSLIARGTANLRLNNLAAARADMQRALQVQPNSPASYVNLAAVARAEKRFDETANLLDRALAIDPLNLDALSAYSSLPNHIQNAQARVEAAASRAPDNKQLLYIKSQVFGAQSQLALASGNEEERQRNIALAEQALRRAIEIDSQYASAYYALAAIFVNTNRSEQAIAEYQKVVEQRPEDSAAHTMIGILEQSRNNYEAAEAAYRKALNADANSDIALNNAAWLAAEHGRGNLDEAIAFAQKAVQRNPNQVGFLDTLGWVYYKKELPGPAVEQLRKVVQSSSDNATYRYHLGAALAASGDKAGARRELEQALRLASNPNQNFTKADDARRVLNSL